MDTVGEGEGGKIWENGIETCIISCMKREKKEKKTEKKRGSLIFFTICISEVIDISPGNLNCSLCFIQPINNT